MGPTLVLLRPVSDRAATGTVRDRPELEVATLKTKHATAQSCWGDGVAIIAVPPNFDTPDINTGIRRVSLLSHITVRTGKK